MSYVRTDLPGDLDHQAWICDLSDVWKGLDKHTYIEEAIGIARVTGGGGASGVNGSYNNQAVRAAQWRGCTKLTHSCMLKTIDLPIPTISGPSTSGFYPPGRHRVHQARSAVRCAASRMKCELRPARNSL